MKPRKPWDEIKDVMGHLLNFTLLILLAPAMLLLMFLEWIAPSEEEDHGDSV